MRQTITIMTMLLAVLTSCTTTKSTTETEVVRDTLIINHHDTVLETRVLTLHDTLHQRETHTVTLSSTGDTIREVHHHYDYARIYTTDSTYRYKAEMDSMQRLLDKQHDKTTVKEQGGGVKRWEIALYVAILIVFMGALKIK